MSIFKKSTFFVSIVMAALFLLAGCGTKDGKSANDSSKNGKLNVVVTNSILWDMTRNIA